MTEEEKQYLQRKGWNEERAEEQNGGESVRKDQESGSKSGLKTRKWPKKWPNYADVIMDAIERNSKITIDQLVALLPVGNTTTDKVLNAMQADGYIRHDGPSNGGEWIVL